MMGEKFFLTRGRRKESTWERALAAGANPPAESRRPFRPLAGWPRDIPAVQRRTLVRASSPVYFNADTNSSKSVQSLQTLAKEREFFWQPMGRNKTLSKV